MSYPPLVAMVTLTADRPQFAERMIRNFTTQTYPNLELVILDTGNAYATIQEHQRIRHLKAHREPGDTIGRLRNRVNAACAGADIIAHADDDDWSHPERIAEQVAALVRLSQTSRYPTPVVTGYRDMLFWATGEHSLAGRYEYGAYLYSGTPIYMLGTSLCYWRSIWERKPFPEKNCGEDTEWQRHFIGHTVSSLYCKDNPRMIAHIHGANTHSHLGPAFKRVPEWDWCCAETMR